MIPTRIRSELPLILASLFIAMVIWLIAKQADYESDTVQAAVKLNDVPPNMKVRADPAKVSLRVQYPKSQTNMIVDKNFSMPINVSEIFPVKPELWDPKLLVLGKDYKVDTGSVRNEIDQSVQVVSVDPGVVTLTAQLQTLTAQVVIVTTGTLPDNLKLTGIQSDPPQLVITGVPETPKASDGTLKTEPVDLSNVHSSGQLLRGVILPEGVSLVGHPVMMASGGHPMVTINIAVVEKPVRQTLTLVPIKLVTFAAGFKAAVDPPTASVVLEGPASALKAISAGDIEFTMAQDIAELPGKVYAVGLEARLKEAVSGEIAKQVKIIEIKPSRISVEFVPVDKQNK